MKRKYAYEQNARRRTRLPPKERKPYALPLWVKLAINPLMTSPYSVYELHEKVMYMADF